VEDQKVSDIKGFVKTVKDNMSGAGVDLRAYRCVPLTSTWQATSGGEKRLAVGSGECSRCEERLSPCDAADATIAKQLMDRTMKNYSFMKRLEMERGESGSVR
jgi:hypothetical protein